MSSKQSWDLTPREYEALEDVYRFNVEDRLHRTATTRADFFNGHFKHPVDGERWTADDFLNTPEALERREQRERDRLEMVMVRRAAAAQMELMRKNQFPEELLPVWARMTPDEKKARHIN